MREALFKMEELRPLGVARVLRFFAEERRLRAARRRRGDALQQEQSRQQQDGQRRGAGPHAVPRVLAPAAPAGVPASRAEAAAAAAAAAVLAADGPLPAAAVPPCERAFLRELLRQAESQLAPTTPLTLLHQLLALAALRAREPRLLRGMAAAAAAHARRGGYADATQAAALVHCFAALQQPCLPLWREVLPLLTAGARVAEGPRVPSSGGVGAGGSGGGALSPEQLARVAWAAAASAGTAEAPSLRSPLLLLLHAAWRGAVRLNAESQIELAWATAALLERCDAARPPAAHAAPAGDVQAAAAADAHADPRAALWQALHGLLPGLLAAAATGALPLRCPERRAELLHAASLLAARQRQTAGAAAVEPGKYQGKERQQEGHEGEGQQRRGQRRPRAAARGATGAGAGDGARAACARLS
jgi:hypothetical protein